MTLKFDEWPQKTIRHLFYTASRFVHHFKSIGKFKLEDRKRSIRVKISDFLVPHDLKNWQMTLKNNMAPLLCCFKLCASFHSHWYIQSGVMSPETLNSGQNWWFLSCVILKLDGWPWKKIGHLLYTISNFVHHFKSIGEVKLVLQSGNAQFASKLVFFCPAWPWNLMDDLEKQ